jgi:hypothetical protein
MKDNILFISGLLIIAGAMFMAGRWSYKPSRPIYQLQPAAKTESRVCAGDCPIFTYPTQHYGPYRYAI